MTDKRDTPDEKSIRPERESTVTGNYLCVAGGLQIFKTVLAPYVARELRAQFSDQWWRRGVLEVLHENQRRKLPVSGDDIELIRSLDESRCLLLMKLQWNELFHRKLSDDHRIWLKELMSTLTRWAHVDSMAFAGEEVGRALDTMGRFVDSMDEGAAERIRALARTVRFRNAGGSTPVIPGDSPQSPGEGRRAYSNVPANVEGETEGIATRFELDEGPGAHEARRRPDGEIASALPLESELAAQIRSDIATAAGATQRSRTASPTPTVRSGGGSAPRTVIAGARPSIALGGGGSQAGPHGWLPAAIGTTMRIHEPLPTRGAEADLYIVEDAAGKRQVAKIYRHGIAPKAEVLDRIREASATHVVRLEDYGVEDGRWWELLEHIEHRSLRERLAEAGGALPDADVRCVLAQLADGLDSLHAIGLEHRDLKPENVLVRCGAPLDVVIADWGIASMVEATVHFTTMARTIRYAPPEAIGNVVTSEEGVDRTVSAIERTRWDTWSLGMMTVEMKTGMHPFAQVSEQVVGHRLATQSVDALCEHVTDPAWRRLCRGLLRRQPADRWGTAEVRRWLANADDSTLTIADDQPVRAYTGIDFDGRHFTDRRALGRALQQADQAKAESFWKRRFRDLRTWITDSLGEGALGMALEDVARDPNLSLDEQVFGCIHLLWPEAPIIVDGVPFREDVLHEMARRAWEGDDEAAALLVRIAVDPHVSLAVGLDATGVVDWIHKAWQRAADHYANASRILAGQDLSIPEWRNADFGSPDQAIEVGTVADVEIGVDTITGAPRLPVQIQAGVLGAAIGETTCSKALRTMAERATARWGEVEPLLAEMGSHGAVNPALLAATIYGALDLQKQENEAARHREAAERHKVRKAVWGEYGMAVGLCLGAVLAVWVEFEFEPTTAWFAWIYLAIAVVAAISGSILGKRMEDSVSFWGWLAPPVDEPGTAEYWGRRHDAWATNFGRPAVYVLVLLMLYRWLEEEVLVVIHVLVRGLT